MRRTTRSAPRPLRRSVVAGVVLALLVLAGGLGYASVQHQTYTAESVLVVLPRANLDDATAAAYYETMSRGQIVGTFAEVADNPTFRQQSLDRLRLTPAEEQGIATTVTVVPDTSVILVRVTARTAATAERVADATAGLATSYLGGLTKAYRTQIVHSATGSAAASGTSPLMLVVLSVVVALTVGVAVQQAWYHLAMARRLTTADLPDARAQQEPSTTPAPELTDAGRR